MPLIAAKKVFHLTCNGANFTIFVDNEGTRLQLMNGYAADKTTAEPLETNALTDEHFDCMNCVAKVPTCANMQTPLHG